MSFKALQNKLKPRTAAPAAETAEAIERARRAETIARGQATAAQKQAEEAQKRADEAIKARDAHLLESTLSSTAAKLRAHNPSQVVKLRLDAYELVEGKVRPKDKPEAELEAHMGEWLASAEGKHFVSPMVPGGGAGAPANPTAPKAATAHDLTTAEGATAYARERVKNAKRS